MSYMFKFFQPIIGKTSQITICTSIALIYYSWYNTLKSTMYNTQLFSTYANKQYAQIFHLQMLAPDKEAVVPRKEYSNAYTKKTSFLKILSFLHNKASFYVQGNKIINQVFILFFCLMQSLST